MSRGESKFGTTGVGRFHKVKSNNNTGYCYVSSKNNLQGYKEHIILFIAIDFGEDVNIIECIGNMKLYLSHINKSY